jgi:hypothetical protein
MWTNIEDLGSGIYVYKNLIKKEFNIIDRLNSAVGSSDSGNLFSWRPAYVGYDDLVPDYRDCEDFKFNKKSLESIETKEAEVLREVWQDCHDLQKAAVDDYCAKHNISELRYWEVSNFVKYNKGQHFEYHHDHGYSYNCTVSLVAYLNDDFDGGELHFSKQDILYKPNAGDLVIFPSNYMYPHRAMPVHSGTKYSLVTMLDYSDKFHKPEFYTETGS